MDEHITLQHPTTYRGRNRALHRRFFNDLGDDDKWDHPKPHTSRGGGQADILSDIFTPRTSYPTYLFGTLQYDIMLPLHISTNKGTAHFTTLRPFRSRLRCSPSPELATTLHLMITKKLKSPAQVIPPLPVLNQPRSITSSSQVHKLSSGSSNQALLQGVHSPNERFSPSPPAIDCCRYRPLHRLVLDDFGNDDE